MQRQALVEGLRPSQREVEGICEAAMKLEELAQVLSPDRALR